MQKKHTQLSGLYKPLRSPMTLYLRSDFVGELLFTATEDLFSADVGGPTWQDPSVLRARLAQHFHFVEVCKTELYYCSWETNGEPIWGLKKTVFLFFFAKSIRDCYENHSEQE